MNKAKFTKNQQLAFSLVDELTDDVPSPYYAWSEHSLPITDIVCGIGSFLTARVLTSSVDHTCKVSLAILVYKY